MKKSLSARREAFCLAVMKGIDASQAALSVGYCPGNATNVRIVAWDLLQKPDIKKRMAELREAAATKAVVTVTERLERLSKIVRGENVNEAIRATRELNLMERIYTTGVNLNIQQNIANISSGAAGTREKLLRMIEAVSGRLPLLEEGVDERQENITIEGGDMDSVLADRCSEEQDTKSLEVKHGKRGTISKAQIG